MVYTNVYYLKDVATRANLICLTLFKNIHTEKTIFITFLNELSWIKYENRGKPTKYLGT